MAAKEEQRDETPTKLVHSSGGTVSVPAYKVEGLLKGGSFSKPASKTAAKKAAASSDS